MNEKNVMDESVKTDPAYLKFMEENSGIGYLKVRASAANAALPVGGIQIKVKKKIDGLTVVFFEGVTDSSGMVNNISLPSPKSVANDEEVPQFAQYELDAIQLERNINLAYSITIFSGVTVIQYINITPRFTEMDLSNYGN